MKVTELFKFVEGDLITTQTRGDTDVTYLSELYTSAYPIKRGAAESKKELSKSSVDIIVDLSNPLAQRHLASPVDTVVTVTIFQQTETSTDVFWKGRLASTKANSKGVTLTCESIFTSLRRPGLRGRYQKSCRHALYAKGCNVDPELHAVTGTLTSVNGVALVVDGLDAYPDGRFRGGMIMAPDGVVRFVIDHAGNNLTLSRPFDQLQNLFNINGPGVVVVKAYPGCQHNMTDCINIFDNLPNYGGFPWIPNKNPVGGSSIV